MDFQVDYETGQIYQPGTESSGYLGSLWEGLKSAGSQLLSTGADLYTTYLENQYPGNQGALVYNQPIVRKPIVPFDYEVSSPVNTPSSLPLNVVIPGQSQMIPVPGQAQGFKLDKSMLLILLAGGAFFFLMKKR